MAVYHVRSHGRKRQPDHHCPTCRKPSRCSYWEGQPKCPVPLEIQCGSCGLSKERELREVAEALLKAHPDLDPAEIAEKATTRAKKAARKKK